MFKKNYGVGTGNCFVHYVSVDCSGCADGSGAVYGGSAGRFIPRALAGFLLIMLTVSNLRNLRIRQLLRRIFPMWRPASSPQPPAVYIIRLWKVLPPAEVPRQKLWSGIPLLRETL